MALTAMVLAVMVELVVMITFLISPMHCRALPSTPSLVAVQVMTTPPSLTVVELSAIELLA